MPNQQHWPEELDALAAAPRNHRLLFENDSVRVLETSIAPSQVTPLHTHRWPATLYILSWSDFVRGDEHGAVIVDSRFIGTLPNGTAMWSPSLGPHTLENTGSSDLHVIVIELKKES
jgi:mannose-6-phosphate isomerase-like protein (cupin superfamily)